MNVSIKILVSKLILVSLLIIINKSAYSQTSSLVSVGTDGKLIYAVDPKGNKIPDYSGVGYMNGEVEIPTVPVVKIVSPVEGDNRANIQNAINEVASIPLDVNGFRGAILFKKGTYNVSNTITISASGIVLQGEGNDAAGTCFVATKTAQHTLFNFAGISGTTEITSTKKQIVDAYVPIGAKQVTVASGHTFIEGDKVFVHRIPNDAWIQLLEMDHLTLIDPLATDWTASGYDIYYERRVTAVNGNIISLDAPIVDLIDPTYASGEVMKYTSARIENCGIENMRISSYYASETDENHGWDAVDFVNVVNGWARNLEVYYFGYSAVNIKDGAAWITVENCKMLDPKSIIDGGRRYSFNIDGQRSIVQNCYTRKGRHDYVDGSRTPGPNVFYNSVATQQYNDIGPHHRWSTGILFDNINGDGRIDVQNRTVSGSGHGWSGAQILFWNCEGTRMVIQDPQGDHRNWAIGCIIPEITNIGDMTTEPLGFVESQGTHITAIPSLYIAQLNERLGSIPPKLTQTITFNPISTKYINDPDFSPGATSSSSLPIYYRSTNTSVATIVGDNIHIVGEGSTIITASQTGDATYNPATSIAQTLTVRKLDQTINFDLIPKKKVNDADFSPAAIASSGLPVSYSSSNSAVATIVNNQIHIVGFGLSTITATQEGNAVYYAALDQVQELEVSKLDQNINFPSLEAKIYGDNDFSIDATSSSGLLVTYNSSNTSVASLDNGIIHIVGAGTSSITASQSGNATYNAAADVIQPLVVNKKDQVITFSSLPPKIIGDSDFSPGASTNSGLSISYSSSNSSVASIITNKIHIVGAGTSIITASQTGNSNYNSAISINQTLSVNKKDQIITFSNFPTKLVGDADFYPGATSSAGLIITYESSNSAVVTIVNGKIHIVGYGSSTITASQAGNATYNPAPSVSQTLTVEKRTQTITFNALPTKIVGDLDFSPGATSSSGLAVTYASLNNSVASIVNGNIHIIGAGTSLITASQPGDAMFYAATEVSQLFTVTPTTSIYDIDIRNADFTIFPNPASTNISASYTLTRVSEVNMIIYDLLGKKVKSLISKEEQPVGSYKRSFEIAGLKSGVYFVQISFGSNTKTVKLFIN